VAGWKARAAAMLEHQAARGVMRERDWRQLFIRGKAPEDAARLAETLYRNTAHCSSARGGINNAWGYL
jgi:hypothetical protein